MPVVANALQHRAAVVIIIRVIIIAGHRECSVASCTTQANQLYVWFVPRLGEGPNLFPRFSPSCSLCLSFSIFSLYRFLLHISSMYIYLILSHFYTLSCVAFCFSLSLTFPPFSSHCQLSMSPYRSFRLLHLTSSQSYRRSLYTSNVTWVLKLQGPPFPVNEIRSIVFLPFLSFFSLVLPCLYQFYKHRAMSNFEYTFDGSLLNSR